MKRNEKLNAFEERRKYTWAKRIGIGLVTVLTATTGFFGVQSHKNAQKFNSALEREQKQTVVSSSLAGKLAEAQQRAKEAEARAAKAEKLNDQTLTVLANAMPAYTTVCDYNADDPKIRKMKHSPEEIMNRENAKEKARYNKACKALGVNPEKLAQLYKNLGERK